MRPQIVIFSSSTAFHIATGLHAQIENQYTCHLWKGDFFGKNLTTPLWTFFKKLFQYDYVIIVLSDDNIIEQKDGEDKGLCVPADNVIFELGACMARLGPQKTIMVTPDKPDVHLSTYFQDLKPNRFYYTNTGDKDPASALTATQAATEGILGFLEKQADAHFHAELPALGLAFAYKFNFLQAVLQSKKEQDLMLGGEAYHWSPNKGVRLIVAIPKTIMDRDAVAAYMTQYQQKVTNTTFAVNDGRNPGVYIINPKSEDEPLTVIDIPTTLLTTRSVVERVEKFWRETDQEKVKETDSDFIKALEGREILNFERAMAEIKLELGERLSIMQLSELDALLQDA